MSSPRAPSVGGFSWQRMVDAVEAVRERTRRTAGALERAGLPYAIADGNAVAAWVSTVDAGAVRNTADVDVLVRRQDFAAVRAALESVGFVYREIHGVDGFLDGPEGGPRDAVHLIYAGERVLSSHPAPAPDVEDAVSVEGFRVVSLEALVRMKLNAHRRKDQVHLQDLLEVGLVDAGWLVRLEPEQAARLRVLIDDPQG